MNVDLNKRWNEEHKEAVRRKRDNDRLKLENGDLLAQLKQEAEDHDAEQQNCKRQLQEQAGKHKSQQERLEHEIAVLDQARCQSETKLNQMSKLDLSFIQLVADNVTNLSHVNVVRQEKADLQARLDQMTADSSLLQQNIDELTKRLATTHNSVNCSRQSCVAVDYQLRATHDKLVTTQQQLELVVESNNDLQHRIDASRLAPDMEYVDVSSSDHQSINRSINQFDLHKQFTLVEQERDEAHRKLRAIASALDDEYVDCFSPQTHSNNETLTTRCEKIESMLDAADATNESLESNSSLRELILVILTDSDPQCADSDSSSSQWCDEWKD